MKYPNVSSALYDDQFQIDFDCIGVETCRFALCSIMPPTGEEECVYRDYGSCKRLGAQLAALEALHKKIRGSMKEMQNSVK